MRPASIFLIIQLSNSRSGRGAWWSGSERSKGGRLDIFCSEKYNPVFDSCWKKKSLYPLYLLGCSDFYRCFEL